MPSVFHAMILIIGDIHRSEMSDLVDGIRSLTESGSKLVVASTIDAGISHCQPNDFPDLVVLLQSWPEEFSETDINRLFAFAPLARVVVCYGDWCESDGRNNNRWPLSVRIPVWAAQCRIDREWRLVHDRGQQDPLPWSASREEVFAADHAGITTWSTPQQILIDSPDPSYRQFLEELLEAEGHTLVRNDASILLFDADSWGTTRIAAYYSLRNQYPQTRVYLLTSRLEPALVAELGRLDVVAIIHKLGFRSFSMGR